MKLGKTLYVTTAKEWRQWLVKHHNTEKEIWLAYYRKDAGKPRIPYNDAVEEALCFGWIDSTYKAIDAERFAQRFTPRKPNSPVSPMNKERIRRLIKAGKMTAVGRITAGDISTPFILPSDIGEQLKKDADVWKHFRKFPESYKRIRIGWIDGARKRPEEFRKRLTYFLKMTAKNKRFGMVQ